MNTQPSMAQITAGLTTTADKIRALHGAGYQRTDIARFLGIRYQYVRNVIVEMERKSAASPVQAPEEKPSMSEATSGLATKSDKIRALDRAGYSRADIARFLDIRYQHVRNVLVHAAERDQAAYTVAEPAARDWLHVAPDGRTIIPPAFRQILDVEDGGQVLVIRDGAGLRLVSRTQAIRSTQAMLAPYMSGVPMTDELMAERRAETARENAGE